MSEEEEVILYDEIPEDDLGIFMYILYFTANTHAATDIIKLCDYAIKIKKSPTLTAVK